jgi:subtilisin family serine protease
MMKIFKRNYAFGSTKKKTISKTTGIFLLFFMVLNLGSLALAWNDYKSSDAPENIIKDELLVKYKSGGVLLTSSEIEAGVAYKEKAFDAPVNAVLSQRNTARKLRAGLLGGAPEDIASTTYKLKLKPNADIVKTYDSLKMNPNVEQISYNYLTKLLYTPNDPEYVNQYNMTKVNAGAAIDINPGDADVVIAVVDSGIRGTHEDLAGKVLEGYDFVANQAISANANSDVQGHGTAVAGTAAALCNNNKGISGIACNNKIMPVRVATESGSVDLLATLRGVIYAVNNGADIINLSLGGERTVVYDYFYDDVLRYAHNNGVVVVSAAGNGGSDGIGDDIAKSTPANSPYSITVGATSQTDVRTSFSNFGAKLDFVAPGVVIPVPNFTGDANYKTDFRDFVFCSNRVRYCRFDAFRKADTHYRRDQTDFKKNSN